MSDFESTQKDSSVENKKDFLLDKARKDSAEKLGIDLSVPKQEKRIEALEKLYEKYVSQINVCGSIYRRIVDACDRLIEIYIDKKRRLEEVKILYESATVIKTKLENINYRKSAEEKKLEAEINFSKELLMAFEKKYINGKDINVKHKKHLKKLEDESWENWLRALDVKKEWINTVIGFENRKAMRKISEAYIDYYILVDSEVSKCFNQLRKLKKDGILEYYDTLRNYKMPLEARMDFKVFLQKKVESKLSDAMEIKSLFCDFAELQRTQLGDSIQQIKNQYVRDQQDIMSVVNYYKKNLLQKQVLFTNEAEQMVIYFKKRYIEKMDLLCSRFQMYNAEMIATNEKINIEDLNLLKKLIDEELNSHLNKVKVEYAKKFIPLLDNFWHLEEEVGRKHALDEETLMVKFNELRNLKHVNVNYLIEKFEEQRKRIKDFFDKKLGLVDDLGKLGVKEFDVILKDLKEECDVICCGIININSRFWTKANAEFNCIIRRIFINLRHQYSPYVSSWRNNSKPWMEEYLSINFNQELLKAAGEALEDFSPESELYSKASKALLYFNEYTRKILQDRDDMEKEQLLKLNTLPEPTSDDLLKESNEKLNSLRIHYMEYWNQYNNFYNSLLK